MLHFICVGQQECLQKRETKTYFKIQQILTETKENMILDNGSPKSVNLELGKINQDETQTYKK